MKSVFHLRTLEIALAVAGVGAAAVGATRLLEGWAFQKQADLFAAPQNGGQHSPQTAVAATLQRFIAPSAVRVLGRLSIPRLHTSVLVIDGDDDLSLRLGVGHVRGTKMPGESGNIALAAHRDTFFRELRNVRAGDRVVLKTRDVTTVYNIATSRIVNPDDTSVLSDTSDPQLTLITCYPFGFVGEAPQRFVVTALVEKDGERVAVRRKAKSSATGHGRHSSA